MFQKDLITDQALNAHTAATERLARQMQARVVGAVEEIERLQISNMKTERQLKVLILRCTILKDMQDSQKMDPSFDTSIWQESYNLRLGEYETHFFEDYRAILSDRLGTVEPTQRAILMAEKLCIFRKTLNEEMEGYRAVMIEMSDIADTLLRLEQQIKTLQAESENLVERSTALQEEDYYGAMEKRVYEETALKKRLEQKKKSLSAACQVGDLETAKAILELQKKRSRAAVLQQFDEQGLSPLHQACSGGHLELVAYLCRMGADARQCTARRGPMLHTVLSAPKDPMALLPILEAAGAPVCALDWHGRSALHVASYYGHLNALIWLVDQKVPLDLQSDRASFAQTALHVAASRGHADIVRYLLRVGANPRLLNIRAETPFTEALLMQRSTVMHVFMEEGVYLSRVEQLKIGQDPKIAPLLADLEAILEGAQQRLQSLLRPPSSDAALFWQAGLSTSPSEAVRPASEPEILVAARPVG